MAMSSAEAGFNQVSVMKMTSKVWVVIVSQISESCLLSVLISMQWSLTVALAADSAGGTWVVVFVVLLA